MWVEIDTREIEPVLFLLHAMQSEERKSLTNDPKDLVLAKLIQKRCFRNEIN